MANRIVFSRSTIGVSPNIPLKDFQNAEFSKPSDFMVSAFMLNGLGTATVNVYGKFVSTQTNNVAKLLGTLTLSTTTPDAFKVSGEFYSSIYIDVTAVASGTVNVVLGE